MQEISDLGICKVPILQTRKGNRDVFHMKVIYVDDELLFMGSANYTIMAAFCRNWGEYYMIQKDELLIKYYMLLIYQCIERYINFW